MDQRSSNSYLSVLEFLLRNDVDHKTAKYVAMNELRNWPLETLSQIFDFVKRPLRKFCPFKQPVEFMKARERIDIAAKILGSETSAATGNKKKQISEIRWSYFKVTSSEQSAQEEKWLAAPRDLMMEAAEQGRALCVNSQGQFAVREQDYIAISHAWIEGLQRDDEHNGVLKSKIDLIFWALRRQCIETEWIWVDVLAIPGTTTKTSSVADDLLKVETINTLADIYQNADGIAIFDTLAWQLESSDPLTVAVALRCGLWTSRLWTFQEAVLSKRKYILTSGQNGLPAPQWSDIVKVLSELSSQSHYQYFKLWQFFGNLQSNMRSNILNLRSGCQTRQTGNDVDYARAFFPTLGLKWKQGMTREEGMQEIYYSQIWNATRSIFQYGCARMSIRPGWAPSSLVGLEGEVIPGLQNEERGIRGEVSMALVASIDKRFRRHGATVLDCSIGGVHVQCKISELERSGTLNLIDTASENETLWLLLPIGSKNDDTRQEFARVALLAAQAVVEENDGFECVVLCAILILSHAPFPTITTTILIRHGSAVSHDMDLDNQLQYMWFRNSEMSVAKRQEIQKGELPIHRAVRNNDIESVKTLVADNSADIHAYDSTGLSALHIAASRGNDTILSFLLSLKDVDANLPSKTPTKDSPITMAAYYNQTLAIGVLIEHNVPVDFRNGNQYTPLMVAAYQGCLETVELLLAHGADPNANGSGSIRETPLKLTCDRTHPYEGRLNLAKALLDAGADPNGLVQSDAEDQPEPEGNESLPKTIWPALTVAAEWSNLAVIELLLERGADPNRFCESLQFSAVKLAIERGRLDVLRSLFDHGAKADMVFGGGWTLLHFATQSKDFNFTRMILSHLTPQGTIRLITTTLDEGDLTPIDLAEQHGNRIVEKLLTQALYEALETEG